MSKKLWIAAAVAAAVVVVYLWASKDSGFLGLPSSSESPSPSPSPSVSVKPSTRKPGATPVSSSKQYSDLLKEYEGRIIQFDERCQTVPSNPTYKNGASIMIDNRSADARVIKIGNTSYSLSGFGYKVVTLKTTSAPQELNIICGSSGNVGKILLQALISQ